MADTVSTPDTPEQIKAKLQQADEELQIVKRDGKDLAQIVDGLNLGILSLPGGRKASLSSLILEQIDRVANVVLLLDDVRVTLTEQAPAPAPEPTDEEQQTRKVGRHGKPLPRQRRQIEPAKPPPPLTPEEEAAERQRIAEGINAMTDKLIADLKKRQEATKRQREYRAMKRKLGEGGKTGKK